MGYQIQYGQTIIKKLIREKETKSEKSVLIKGICIGCVLLVLVFLGNAGCLDFLIPGDKAITKQAFSSMVDEVGNGGDVKTAITAFCLEILEGAETSH